MKMTRKMAAVVFVAGSGLALQFALAQGPIVKRIELQRHDMGTPGQEAVQFRVDYNPGAAIPRHSHPGEEITYILEGSLEFEIDGKPNATLKAGDVLFIPAGMKKTSPALSVAVGLPSISNSNEPSRI